jgi:N-methylhydantoinase B
VAQAQKPDLLAQARELIESGDYDPIIAEVLRMRFNNIVEEMGVTLKNTSGSPILTEANDFSTNILDSRAGISATGSFILFHLGSATECLKSILARYPEETIKPGDAIIVNDPYLGSPHKPDIGVLTPLHYEGELVNWVWTAAHMYDIGGISPGSFSPQVLDTYGEGLMIPPLKIVKEGEINDDLRQIIEANSRLPVQVFNDIRCLIATNNVALDRLREAIEYYGVETYRLYSNLIGVLSENAFRERIAKIPDGVYRSVDWMEHDGHEHALYEARCAMTVSGDEIEFDFEGSSPQAPGLLNCGPGGLLGNVMSPIVQMLCYDLQINFGLINPIKIKAPKGTVVNATEPAATGYGHLDAGYKVSKMVTELMSQALQVADDPWLRSRVMGQFNDSWSIETWGGNDQYGRPFAWLNMDGGGFGGGAQTAVDGMDVAGDLTSVGNAIPDIEWTEQIYPALHFWRRLEPNSGGPGEQRGGAGLDLAWTMWETEDELLTGTVVMAMFSIPSRGHGGGWPGSSSRIMQLKETNAHELLEQGVWPGPATLEASETFLSPPKFAPLRLRPGDVMRHFTGGGAGVGEPLLRDPELVARQVRYGWLTREHAQRAYGVAVNDEGQLDVDGTESLRRELRAERTGGEPRPINRAQSDGDGHYAELYLASDTEGGPIQCVLCGVEICGAEEDWRDHVRVVENELSERLKSVGMWAAHRPEGPIALVEFFCPGCGTSLRTQVSKQGMPKPSSVELRR